MMWMPLMYLIFFALQNSLPFKDTKTIVMRTAALALFLVAFTFAASAQKFTLLPQAGFENSRSIIQFNDQNSLAPLGVRISPQASLRLNYTSKTGQGFYVGLASSRSTVLVSFTNPETAISSFTSMAGSIKPRLEAGYQFTSPKINLGKAKQVAQKSASSSSVNRSSGYSGRCGSYSASRCGNKNGNEKKVVTKPASWVRIQPSIGLGFIPGTGAGLISKPAGTETAYEYRAANYNTALLTGANIEFGKGSKGLMTISLSYFNGNGLNKQSITTSQGNKISTTTLRSDVSGWNLRVGIPFSMSKISTPKTVKTQNIEKKEKPQNRCGQYRVYRCGGRSI
jgi:hypothetical protein